MAAGQLSSAIEAIARDVRAFLEPHWRVWHTEWGPPFPETASQWTCSRSSSLLAFALNRAGFPAYVQSGRPSAGREFGFYGMGEWHDHAWVVVDDRIIDITKDQFAESDVAITPVSDPAYRAGTDPDTRLTLSRKGEDAVERLKHLWMERFR